MLRRLRISDESAVGSGGGALGALAVGAGALAIYSASYSPNLAAAHDSVRYLNLIDRGTDLLHRHHLLFAPLARLWLDWLRGLGLAVESSRGVAQLDAAAGACCLGLFYAFLRRRAGLPAGLAGAATLCAGGSFGLWFYSASVEVYVIPLALALLALYALTGEGAALRRYAIVGGLQGLAMLFHALHGLLLPVVAWWAWRELRPERGQPWVALAAYAGALGLVVLGGYGYVVLGVLGLEDPGEVARFVGGYALGSQYWYPPSLETPLRAGLGAGRSVLGGHFVLALPAVRGWLPDALATAGLRDEMYLVRDLSPWVAGLLGVISTLLLAALAALWLGAARRHRGMEARSRSIAALAAVWLCAYAIFFCFWVPHNVEFWLPQSLALWILTACGLMSFERRDRAALALALVGGGLALVNYVGSLRPLGDRANDYYYAWIEPYRERAGERDLIVVGTRWLQVSYLERFTKAQVVSLELLARDQAPDLWSASLGERIESTLAQGGAVFVADDAVRLEPTTIERMAPGSAGAAAELWARYAERWTPIDGPVAGLFWIRGGRDAGGDVAGWGRRASHPNNPHAGTNPHPAQAFASVPGPIGLVPLPAGSP